jgi:hypothetical protein
MTYTGPTYALNPSKVGECQDDWVGRTKGLQVMNIDRTPDDNATTWRNLVDQLIPAQIERLSGMEQRSALPADDTAAALEGAREWAQNNVQGRVMFGHLPTPAGAGQVFLWEDDGSGGWSRRFDGTKRGNLRVSVDIVGVQYADGSVERSVFIDAHGVELDRVGAWDLGDALQAACYELDNLA